MFEYDFSGLAASVANYNKNSRGGKNNGGRSTWSAVKLNNKNNNKNNNRGNNNFRSRGLTNWDNDPLDFSGLRNSDRGNKNNNRNQNNNNAKKPSKESQVELDSAVLESFVKDFTDNKTNTAAIYEIIQRDFVNVCKMISDRYYDPKYEDVVKNMNAVLKLFTTQLAATALSSSIKDEALSNFNEDKLYIAAFISLLLDTSNTQMTDKTIGIYVEIISEFIWKNEIKEMTARLGMEEDVAIDMVIAAPFFGTKMTESQLRAYVPKYLSVLMDYSNDLIDSMDAENQKKWFYAIFPDENNQGLKAAGKCLAYELIDFGSDEEKKALYSEYIKMLYMILDEHDIVDIKMVLRYIVKEIKRRQSEKREDPIVFNVEYATQCSENISKAVIDYCRNDQDAKECLA